MKKIIDIQLCGNPHIETRAVLFNDDKDAVVIKNKKQFITTEESSLKVKFNDDTVLTIYAPAYKEFDGATIPLGIGKGDMKLQIPALFHDIICEEKWLVNYDRKLANTIFKQCLIKCKVNKLLAEYLYLHVEIWQKLMCNWRKPDE